ncbi:hypothetical protein SAY87_001291 [Trapa incisa]|uniref:peroxidase n=1 Tax=Trapa incisa TaxID=236973 RepID=A0AAN7JHJ2_9MYRT|nr:hypothetical protein SAY87_001291 [Trapa incisa]
MIHNINSLRGFDVIDNIKADAEKLCPSTVSCADIIVLAARDAIALFTSKGLDIKDVVALTGGHTIGYAQCFTFKRRLYNFNGARNPDPALDSDFLSILRSTCPNVDSSNTNIVPLDSDTTYRFDNAYYSNLVKNSGLLESDQALMTDMRTAPLVNSYNTDQMLFYKEFGDSMDRLGSIGILTGQNGQIRNKCGSVNQ